MKMPTDVGVVIGRFQVAELHGGHRYLISEVLARHEHVLVLVGVHLGQPTNRDPMDYAMRREMISEIFPGVVVYPLYDQRSDDAWSGAVDAAIETVFPGSSAVLYGSRDSFLPYYRGRYTCSKLPEIEAVSGTVLRDRVSKESRDRKSFREGVIFATTNMRFPVSYQVVDIAILHPSKPVVLLGKKQGEHDWRFIGGFVDPTDENLESAARRETSEETGGIIVDDFRYVGSAQIPDKRYAGTRDGMMTAFFVCTFITGEPRATDDIVEVDWKHIDDIPKNLIPDHVVLGAMLRAHVQTFN